MGQRNALPVVFYFLFTFISSLAQSNNYGESFHEPTVHSIIPAGVPATSLRRNDCFLPGELAEWARRRPRIVVQGCSQPIIAPIRELNLNSSSQPGEYGIGYVYSCQRLRAYTYNVDGIQTALNEFIRLANQASQTQFRDSKVTCLASTLHAWGSQNGLANIQEQASENDLRVARAVRSWNVGAFASVYLKLPAVRSEAIRMNKNAVIQQWFATMGGLILADVRASYATQGDRHKKNIYFWKGYTLAALGIATRNSTWVRESQRIFNIAIGQIQGGVRDAEDKGFMRFEVLKKNRAHTYHLFALKPILGMLILYKALDCQFGHSTDVTNKLAFLIRKIAEGNKNPRVFADRTGYIQLATRPVETHLAMLPDDDQKSAILSNVRSYLAERDMNLSEESIPFFSNNYLGGTVHTMPSPGSYGEVGISREFSQICE